MALLDRFKFWLMGKTMSFMERPPGVPIHRFSDFNSFIEAGCTKIWVSWRACDAIAQAVVETPMQIRRIGGSDPVAVAGLSALLTVPNNFETWEDILYKLVMHVRFTGNAFLFKDEALPGGKRPRKLYLLNPKNVKIIPDKERKIRGYIYEVNGQRMPLEPDEVIHFFRPHPNSDFFGLGDIEAGQDLGNEWINRNRWVEKYWKNGASPSGVLVLEDRVADPKQWDELKKRWHKEYGGVENSGKTAWLSGKWKYQQLGLSNSDMQDLEKSRWNAEQICHLHGVPLSVIGLKDAANYATARIDDVRFRRSTVKPMCTLVAKTLTSDLAADFGAFEVVFEVSGLVDAADAISAWGPVFDRGGMTLNELREAVGLERKEDPLLEQHFVNAGLTPLELSGITVTEPNTQQAARMVVDRFIQSTFNPAQKTQAEGLESIRSSLEASLASLANRIDASGERSVEVLERIEQRPQPQSGDVSVSAPEVKVEPVINIEVKMPERPNGKRQVQLTKQEDGSIRGELIEG